MSEEQEQPRHLSISDVDRLKLLDLLQDEDFREAICADPGAALSAAGIEHTEDDLVEIQRDEGVKLPSVDDLQQRRMEYLEGIIINGAAFFILRFWCRTPDRPE